MVDKDESIIGIINFLENKAKNKVYSEKSVESIRELREIMCIKYDIVYLEQYFS